MRDSKEAWRSGYFRLTPGLFSFYTAVLFVKVLQYDLASLRCGSYLICIGSIHGCSK
ncbi:hypothetical protein [Paenibacillus xylanexedens]|uniref:hypothetical protein n=1 Tax=Paenibacillus xylanexedens TaxID=528191 RepID=UPI00164236AA|nr:hypothetical protein [Paenibacillus xylanexedens]